MSRNSTVDTDFFFFFFNQQVSLSHLPWNQFVILVYILKKKPLKRVNFFSCNPVKWKNWNPWWCNVYNDFQLYGELKVLFWIFIINKCLYILSQGRQNILIFSFTTFNYINVILLFFFTLFFIHFFNDLNARLNFRLFSSNEWKFKKIGNSSWLLLLCVCAFEGWDFLFPFFLSVYSVGANRLLERGRKEAFLLLQTSCKPSIITLNV